MSEEEMSTPTERPLMEWLTNLKRMTETQLHPL
jgi:hypothetical protein